MPFARVALATAVDPAAALENAKTQIATKNYERAEQLLEEAIDATALMERAAEQAHARTALHFYAAVASCALGRDEDALSHLRETLLLSPHIRSVDEDKYGARFAALFERARGEVSGAGRFQELYPGYENVEAADSPESTLFENPAVEYLGSRQEKRAWREAVSPEERTHVNAEFWRLRDPTPESARNEFRETFGRRIAFADTVFHLPAQRGALTDRGHVFAVLGAPSLVRRRSLSGADPVVAMNRGSIGIEVGTVEYWFYRRDQLPVASGKATVVFRFVSHQGVGDFVLQRDGVSMNVLEASARVTRRQ
jgi:GWxTD domain-containing protein